MSTDLNLENGNGQGNGKDFNPIIQLLIREGHVSAQQAEYAKRVASPAKTC